MLPLYLVVVGGVAVVVALACRRFEGMPVSEACCSHWRSERPSGPMYWLGCLV